MSDETEWKRVWQSVQTFVQDFPDDTIAIGGVAVYLHSLASGDLPAEFTHDADFSVGLPSWAEMRDYYDVTTNRRLGKHQAVIDGIEFDIYVARQNKLRLDFDDLARHAMRIQNVNVAHPEHLLLLKLDALRARFASSHGQKDRRDVAKLLILLRDTPPRLAPRQLTDDDVDLIDRVMRSTAFSDIANGNAHRAKALKKLASVYVNALKG